MLTLTSEVQRK